MLKKIFIEFVLVLSIFLLVACSNGSDSGGNTNNNNQATLNIEEYVSTLSDEKTTHLKSQTNLLLHPLKEAFELYGNDYEFSWHGNYVKIRAREDLSIAFQHEIDHLDGILFYDRINKKKPFFSEDEIRLI